MDGYAISSIQYLHFMIFMYQVLRSFMGRFIVVYSPNLESYLEHLNVVLTL